MKRMSKISIEAARAMGAKGGPVVEDERLAFEAWMRGHCWALGAEWKEGAYLGRDEVIGRSFCQEAMITRQLWAAWRDRAALTPPNPLKQTIEALLSVMTLVDQSKLNSRHRDMFVRRMDEALEALRVLNGAPSVDLADGEKSMEKNESGSASLG